MVRIIDPAVNSVRIQTNPDTVQEDEPTVPDAPVRRRMGVVERERQILDGAIQFFSVHGFNGQLRDLAKSIGTTKARVFRYLKALVGHGYVLQDPVSKRYLLGHGVFTLAKSAQMQQNFSRLTQPIMTAVARELKQSVALSEPSAKGVSVLDVVSSGQPLDINTRVGSLFSLHASAQGWIPTGAP